MSAQLRYVGVFRSAETKVRELLARVTHPLTAKQIAQRLGYAAENQVRDALALLVASGDAKSRKSWQAQKPLVYLSASQPWPEDRTSRGELRAPVAAQ